jgi:DNA ligase-1
LIPIGGYYGKGARTGVFGSYLMAAYNTQTRCFESVCKLGTGFSQQNLIDLHLRVKRLDSDERVAKRVASEIFKVSNN